MYLRIAVVLLALVLGLGVAACGGDDDGDATAEETTTETTDDGEAAEAGRSIFVDNCGTCHTLSDAGTSGTVGPSLDGTTLEQDAIEQQVREGGGAMPPFEGQLSDEEIESVAEYVASQG